MPQEYYQGGETLYVYSNEDDGTVGQDALAETFKSLDELRASAKQKRRAMSGFLPKIVHVYKIKLEYVKCVDLE